MGGKSYFCDYCRCFMKNDINVRKTHKEGMLHRMNKVRYMKKFEDPRKVYEEEIAKPTCLHFLEKRCRYDLLCQSSHYNQNQLKVLKEIADNFDERKHQIQIKSGLLPTPHQSSVARMQRQKRSKSIKNLPPSLRPLNYNKLIKYVDDNCRTWG